MTTSDRTMRRALVERYRDGTALVLETARQCSEEELDAVPADGGWSARQVVHHLADAETMSATRLRRLLAEDDPVIHAYPEERFAACLHYHRPIGASLAVVAAVRAASLELIDLLTEEEWARSGTHTDDGPYDVSTWLRTYVAHAEDHAAQIVAARPARPPT